MSIEIQETVYNLEIETTIGLIDTDNSSIAHAALIAIENIDSITNIDLADKTYETITDTVSVVELSSSSAQQLSINSDFLSPIPADYIIGLNEYLSNFIDNYEIDCGLPSHTRLQLRRDVSNNWTINNPILYSGEIGYETNTGRFKIGDGTTSWINLDYNAIIPAGFLAGSGLNVSIANDGSTVTYSLSDPTIQLNDITDLTSQAKSFLETPSSFNLSSLVTDEIGSGSLVFASGATLYNVTLSGSINIGSESLNEIIEDTIGNKIKAGSNIDINYNDTNGETTVSTTGVSLIGHLHTVSDIINFNSGVNDLLPVKDILGSGYVNVNATSGNYTISVSGLQPSGNYSIVGHTHTASNITDFNSSVSGLIPPSNFTSLVGISGITVSNSGTNYIVRLTDPTIQLNDITDLSTNAISFLLTPNSLNLSNLITDETGSGLLVFNNSPIFTGNPRVPTATAGTNTAQIASTAFVRTEISNLVDYAPGFLDTLNELANALGDDPNFATTITTMISNKVSKDGDTMTGTLYAPSGVFSSGLTLNGNTVSVVGHTHTSSNIIDFNSSVSGLLPIISNSGNNRLLTSTGTSTGINAENNLTFDGTTLSISGSLIVDDLQLNSNIISANKVIIDGGPDGVVISGTVVPSLTFIGSTPSMGSVIFLDGYTNNNISLSRFNNTSVIDISTEHGAPYSTGIINFYADELTFNGIPISISGHTHIASQIIDFNSSVSGLIPVKNILAGSGIVVSSISGIYTIDANISGVILETIQDNLGNEFLVEGTGVQLTYNDSANTLTLNNLHTEINELSLEPQGFVNRLDSIISFNDSTRTFTIAPSGSSYEIYIEGVKVTKTTSESIVIGSGTALNYIHFNTDTGLLDTKTTGFNFDTDVPIAFIHWNSDINQSTFFGEERHGIRMDSMTHKWIHNTFGMQYINGLSIGGYTLSGNGSLDSHAQIDISDGTLYQEDIIINIADGNNGVEFTQQLSPIAYIPVYYHSGSTGQWVRDVSTPYPLKYNATRALYNLYSGGTWTTPNVPNNRYFAMWIVATNDINDPVLAIMGQREDSSLGGAENNNNWGEINLTNIPTNELRPLYRLIFVTNDTFANTSKSSLQSILDLRKSIITSTYGVTQNDHGSLFGLGDDDHSQYVHINEARTISANHTFTNGLTINNGLLSATSGNFTAIQVNGTGVSVSGHSHTASNITDFSSSVSGLLPLTNIVGGTNISVIPSGTVYTISVSGSLGLTTEEVDDRVASLLVAGSGINLNYDDSGNILTISSSGSTILNPSDNRILTSNGTTNGINGESNLTFDGSVLNVDGNIVFDSFTESVVSIGSSGPTKTLSIEGGTVQTCTLTSNCVFTMPSAVAGKSFSMFLNTGSGNYTASFSGVLWSDSAPPTVTTTSNKVDILSFISDGTYWYGSYSQNYG